METKNPRAAGIFRKTKQKKGDQFKENVLIKLISLPL